MKLPAPIDKKSSEIKGRRGGKRPGAGRPKGARTAKSLEIEARAQEHAGDALAALAHIAKKGESESARVAAANSLLDRAYGRAKQAVEHTGEAGGPIEVVVEHRVVDAD